MNFEYKIKFVDGAVIITQNSSGGPRPPVRPPEHKDLGDDFKVNPNQAPVIAPQPAGPVSKTLGAGEPSPDSTGGGGPFGPGITIVFGAVFCTGSVSTLGSGEPSSDSPGGAPKK